MASPKKSALNRLRWLLLAPIPLLWCALAHYGFLEFAETRMADLRFRYRGPISAPIKIIYVDVDSLALQEIGNMPWSRKYFADVAKTLIDRGGVKAIGMDFVFSEAGEAEWLAATLTFALALTLAAGTLALALAGDALALAIALAGGALALALAGAAARMSTSTQSW